MSDTKLWPDDATTKGAQFEIDVRRLRMRDYALFSENGSIPMEIQVAVLARATNQTEDTIWDLDLESFTILARALDSAVTNIIKKTNAGNSTSS